MEFSLLLLKKTITLAAMILMGFLSVRSRKLRSEDSSVLSRLCFDWVIPCSVFNAFLIDYTPEIARDFRFSILITCITVIVLIFITVLLKKPLRLDPSEQGSLMFTNSAGMALPLASSLLGSKGILLCAPQMGIQNFLIFTYLPAVMSGKADYNLKKVLLSRNIIAIFCGLLVFFLRIPLPGVLKDTVNIIGGTMAPFSMFMIGMLMGGVDVKELFARRSLYLVTILRLIGYPLLLILVIAATGITKHIPYSRDILLVLLMCEASPAATLVTQMADVVAGQDEARQAGSINMITTLLCIVTIPIMIFIYQLVL